VRLWARNISFLLLIGATLGNLGFLGGDLYPLIAFLSFAAFIWTFFPSLKIGRRVPLPAVVAAALTAAAGILLSRLAPLGLFHLYLFGAAAFLLLGWRHESGEMRHLQSYVVALACTGLLAELVRILPILWHLRKGLASALSWVGENLAREDRNLGPTAMALPTLVALILLVLVREAAVERRHRYRWAMGLLVLVAAHLLYLAMLKYYARWVASHRGWDWLILNSQHVFLILGSIAYTLFDRGRPVRWLGPLPTRRVAFATSLAFALGVAAAMTLGWTTAPGRGSPRVMIYDAGYMNWKVPVHGVYGERSAGMFGMLPAALQSVGFDVIASDDLTRLEGADAPACIVMINIQEYLEDEDKERIWRFIERGGGLLCLGDHTGVAGIRGPFNDLLEPVGIRFRFDSSTFFGDGWSDALDYRAHPMNRGVTTAEDFQIWVGATLDIDVNARPVVVGRYGYSDIGDAANIARSYLGDRRYNPDELLGDVVLVADARYGRGKVMVFGDTSGYQNLSLGRTLDTVARSLDYLSAGGRFGPGVGTQIGGLIAVLLVVLASLALAANPVPIVAMTAGLAIGSAAMPLVTTTPQPLIPVFAEPSWKPIADLPFEVERSLAVIDVSHGGHHTLRGWKDRSLGGLQLNLARNGYFPVIRPEFPYGDLENGAKVLLLVAPARRYSQGEIDAVERFVTQGGRVVATVGFEELDASRGLLERFGLTVANIPLGQFEIRVEADTLAVNFREAWPVRFDATGPADVLLSQWDYPLVVRRAVGKGDIVLIGDSAFFHDVNLETRDRYFAGNVAFLRELTAMGTVQ